MTSPSFDLDNSHPPLFADALQVGVFRYDPDAQQPYELLPNVRCLRINTADASVGDDEGLLPNKCADGTETETGDSDGDVYAVFVDPGIQRDPDPRAYWAVQDALQYLLARYNKDQTYVKLSKLARDP